MTRTTSAARGGVLGFLHHAVGQRLAEPDHAGPRQSAAGAVRRELGQGRAAVGPVGAADGAAHAPDVAVQFEHAAAARAVVQTVHVLRDQGEVALLDFELRRGPCAPGWAAAFAISSRRQLYHSQTRRGSSRRPPAWPGLRPCTPSRDHRFHERWGRRFRRRCRLRSTPLRGSPAPAIDELVPGLPSFYFSDSGTSPVFGPAARLSPGSSWPARHRRR